jgi:hypothetical protein
MKKLSNTYPLGAKIRAQDLQGKKDKKVIKKM